jgi:hypothetical protein
MILDRNFSYLTLTSENISLTYLVEYRIQRLYVAMTVAFIICVPSHPTICLICILYRHWSNQWLEELE